MGIIKNNKANISGSTDNSSIDAYLESLMNSASKGSNQDRTQGRTFSQTEVAQMQYDRMLTEDERAYNEYLYNTYESPAAMVAQYKEAGLNPALMYGSDSSGSVASSDTQNTGTQYDASSGMDSALGVISAIQGFGEVGLSLAQGVSQIKQRKYENELLEARVRETEANTEKLQIESRLAEIDSRYREDQYKLGLKSVQQDINNKIAQERETYSKIDVNTKEIEFLGSKIALTNQELKTEEQRTITEGFKALLTKIQAQEIQTLLPYKQALMVAQEKLANAQTDHTRQQYETEVHNTKIAFLKACYDQNLLDGGITDLVLEQMNLDLKLGESELKTQKVKRWTTAVDCVVGNLCDVVNAGCNVAGTVMTGGMNQMFKGGQYTPVRRTSTYYQFNPSNSQLIY